MQKPVKSHAILNQLKYTYTYTHRWACLHEHEHMPGSAKAKNLAQPKEYCKATVKIKCESKVINVIRNPEEIELKH